ncbi:MAG: GNAT family N-acetyltransferase [bacterium]|nr:GNAT family N-acetyltransferase [bacterium]
MSQIRRLFEEDLDRYVNIVAEAYPGFKIVTPEDKQKLKERLVKHQEDDPGVSFWGLFRDEKMLGGMRLHDLNLQMYETQIKAGGVGMVAVDLLHKKEKICREMIAYFLEHYRQKGYNLATLYPFRPDFYKKMGFGYGTRAFQFRTRPDQLPKGSTKSHVKRLETGDLKEYLACARQFGREHHGMMEKTQAEAEGLLKSPDSKVYGYKKADQVLGYLTFSFKPADANFLQTEMVVRELVYQDPEVLMELMTFLHSQADQIKQVVFITQDEHLNWLFGDIRDGSENLIPPLFQQTANAGYGMMYRSLNTRRLLEEMKGHSFGEQNCKLKLNIADSFLPANAGALVAQVEFGSLTISDEQEYDAEVWLDVPEFSSLLMGAVDYKTLHRLGLSRISDPAYLNTVDRIFRAQNKPICYTYF